MKELSIKEKAKAYNEALERARNLHKDAVEMENNMTTKTCEIIFPELKKSEDEKIRKDLIIYLRSILSNKKYGDKFIEDWIAWLEKQGEKGTKWNNGEIPNSAWSEEDTQYINDTLALLSFGVSAHSIGEIQEWLQSLNNRVQLKQERSKRIKIMLNQFYLQ